MILIQLFVPAVLVLGLVHWATAKSTDPISEQDITEHLPGDWR